MENNPTTRAPYEPEQSGEQLGVTNGGFSPPAFNPPTYGNGNPPVVPPPPPPGPTAEVATPYAPDEKGAGASRRYLLPVGIVLLGIFLMAAAFALGGEPATFALVGMTIAPLPILAVLAYLGVKNGAAAFFTYLWLGVLSLGVLYSAFATMLPALVKDFGLLNRIAADPDLMRTIPLSEIFAPGAVPMLLWGILLLTIAAIISATMLLRPVRVLASRVVPIDPDNFVHKIALCILTLIFLSSIVPLIIFGGKPPLLEAMQSGDIGRQMEEAGFEIGPLTQIYQFVWTIPAVLLAAGWLIVRDLRGTLVRLAMVRPSARQVLFGIVAGVVLVLIAGFVIDPAINWIWTAAGWPTTDAEAFNGLISELITPIGAVIVGVTAGIGEEMALRGLLQPRIGLIAANLFFTSLHAAQYGVDGLLSVFIVGTVLGIIRTRSNTSTCAIVHGVYNFVAIMAVVLTGGQ